MAKKRKNKKLRNFECQDNHAPNQFEVVYNKRKFDVLGRKTRAGQKLRESAKSEGKQKRERTLLVEYKQRQRANAFIDRRFGEEDVSLGLEERAVARFQRQRLKELTEHKFSLVEPGETDNLTHYGRSLLNGEEDDDFLAERESQGYGDLDANTVANLHFGGGFVPKERESKDGIEKEEPKTKQEIMDEIITKSKAFRVEKAKQKEADVDTKEMLDRDLAELMQTGTMFNLVRTKNGKRQHRQPAVDKPESYDQYRKELFFEAKAKAGDRNKTREETAQEVETMMQKAEQQYHQREGTNVEPELARHKILSGGYAARRAKRKGQQSESTGDALEDDFELANQNDQAGEEIDGATHPTKRLKLSLDERRIQRASGNHPLQEYFREVSNQLLIKHGKKGLPDDRIDADQVSKSGGMSKDEADQGTESSRDFGEGSGTSLSSGSEPTDYDAKPTELATQHIADGVVGMEQQPSSVGDLQMPASDCVTVAGTYDNFLHLVHEQPAHSLHKIIQRLRDTQEPKSGEGGKQELQVLFGHIVQYFAHCAGMMPVPWDELDILTCELLALAREVPLYAATTALARLSRLHDRLSSEFSDGFPPQRQLLLLKLWTIIFPASDRRHSVLTPATLIIASALANCHVTSLEDVRAGMFLSSLGLHIAAPAKRILPEPLMFATQLLANYVGNVVGQQSNPVKIARLGKWTLDAKFEIASKPDSLRQQLPKISLEQSDPNTAWERFLLGALSLISRAADIFKETASFPELMNSPSELLNQLGNTKLPEHIDKERRKVMNQIAQQSSNTATQRRPLRREKRQAEVKQFNPRFEDDFALQKDYDPDRERAEARKLKRMLVKERRGAIRELRKDAVFLADESGREKATQRSELKASLKKNNAWVRKLEQDLMSGGQGGKWKKGKKL